MTHMLQDLDARAGRSGGAEQAAPTRLSSLLDARVLLAARGADASIRDASGRTAEELLPADGGEAREEILGMIAALAEKRELRAAEKERKREEKRGERKRRQEEEEEEGDGRGAGGGGGEEGGGAGAQPKAKAAKVSLAHLGDDGEDGEEGNGEGGGEEESGEEEEK